MAPTEMVTSLQVLRSTPCSPMTMHASNSIIKFADDTTVVGLIINNDEAAYREEVRAHGVWCQENNLALNVNKTKMMIMDFRKQQRVCTTHHRGQTTCPPGHLPTPPNVTGRP